MERLEERTMTLDEIDHVILGDLFPVLPDALPEVQERLLAPEGMVAYSPAEGRGQKYLAEIKGCATSSEAIISPRSFRIREPCA